MIHLLHQSVSEHARLRPKHDAFRCRADRLSYKELDTKSNQLANYLIELGVKPSSRVGIYLPKSIEIPVSTFGIMKAAAAYVPIDPSSQTERLSYILNDCGIEILITCDSKLKTIEQIDSSASPLKHIIGISENRLSKFLSSSWEQINRCNPSLPIVPCCEEDLAYVMYTSGSTGAPKGLMHTHSSGMAYARHSADLYSVDHTDVLGNHAPLHFDISTFEYLTGPLVGATTVLIPEEAMLFPSALSELIQEERLTFWYSVPLALIQLITRGSIEEYDLSSLRWVLFGGEPFPPKYLNELIRKLPKVRFCNVYGPAEVNQCTFYHIPQGSPIADKPIPIGQVWAAAHHLLLDHEETPITGEGVGELVISSASMMQGYWGRPDLNAKAFYFEEPVSGFKRRYYRTGDILRRDSDNLLHFVGRRDRQIKLRGYRIELDEVEAAFTKQKEIEETAAILMEDEQGEKYILAIASPKPGATIDADLSLQNAKAALPSYAIPRQLIATNQFPRTGSGKIDRTKLPALYHERPLSK